MTGPGQAEQRRRIWRALHPDDREQLNDPDAITDLPDIADYEPADR